MPTRFVLAFIAVVSAFLWSSCSDDPNEGKPIPPQELQAILSVTSDFQKALVVDGVLTFVEYESGVLSYIDCMEKAGFPLESLELGARQQYVYTIHGPRDEGLERGRAIHDQCHRTYLREIGRLWAFLNRPTEAEVQAARGALADCLREQGAEVPVDPGPGELGPWMPGFEICSQKVSTEYDLPGFGG